MDPSPLFFDVGQHGSVGMLDWGWWPSELGDDPINILSAAALRIEQSVANDHRPNNSGGGAVVEDEPAPLWLTAAVARHRQSHCDAVDANTAIGAIAFEWSASLEAVLQRYGIDGPGDHQTVTFMVLAVATLLFAPGTRLSSVLQACRLKAAANSSPTSYEAARLGSDPDAWPSTVAQRAAYWAFVQVVTAVHSAARVTEFGVKALDPSAVRDLGAHMRHALGTPSTGLVAVAEAARIPKLAALQAQCRRRQNNTRRGPVERPRPYSALQVPSSLSVAQRRVVTLRRDVTPATTVSGGNEGSCDASSVLQGLCRRLSSIPMPTRMTTASSTSIASPEQSRRSLSPLDSSSGASAAQRLHLRRTRKVGTDIVYKNDHAPPLLSRARRSSSRGCALPTPTTTMDSVVVGDPRSFDGWTRLPRGGRALGRSVVLPEGGFRPPSAVDLDIDSRRAWREYEEYLFMHRRASTGDETRRELAKVFPHFGVPVRPVGELQLRVLDPSERGLPARPQS